MQRRLHAFSSLVRTSEQDLIFPVTRTMWRAGYVLKDDWEREKSRGRVREDSVANFTQVGEINIDDEASGSILRSCDRFTKTQVAWLPSGRLRLRLCQSPAE
jgi:hypothetical protein